MGFCKDIGKGIVEGLNYLNNLNNEFKAKIERQKRGFDKNIFFEDAFFDKKYDFGLKVEEDALTFINYSGKCFLQTFYNIPLLVIFLSIAILSFIFLIIDSSKFSCLVFVIVLICVLSCIFIIRSSKTKIYFTINSDGIEVKTNRSRLFIDRDNIADIYVDLQDILSSNSGEEDSSRYSLINFSVYLKTVKPVHLPDLHKDMALFDFFIDDYNTLSKLFVIVFLNESKRILNLPKQDEFFGVGFQNVNVLKDDNSEFVFEKKDKVKISVNKYQVKIEENGSFGNKKNRDISIQNISSLKIFEDTKKLAYCKSTDNEEYSNFGLIVCGAFNKPNILISNLNLDEAVYILRKMNCLRIGNSF